LNHTLIRCFRVNCWHADREGKEATGVGVAEHFSAAAEGGAGFHKVVDEEDGFVKEPVGAVEGKAVAGEGTPLLVGLAGLGEVTEAAAEGGDEGAAEEAGGLFGEEVGGVVAVHESVRPVLRDGTDEVGGGPIEGSELGNEEAGEGSGEEGIVGLEGSEEGAGGGEGEGGGKAVEGAGIFVAAAAEAGPLAEAGGASLVAVEKDQGVGAGVAEGVGGRTLADEANTGKEGVKEKTHLRGSSR
jgi:hypothetical protein